MSDFNVEGKVGAEVQDIDPVNADADEINRYLHEVVMGKCWHEFNNDCVCQKPGCCDDNSFRNQNPAYCSDDSPRRLLNEVVAKMEAEGRLWHMQEELAVFTRGTEDITANAEQIARACAVAWHEMTKAQTH